MLAQNFMTAEALEITAEEWAALTMVLGMLDRGEIRDDQFSMNKVVHACGTPSCLCGWARHVSRGKAFPGHGSSYPVGMSVSIEHLFAMTADVHPDAYRATAGQAAIALRNYLTSGEPRWEDALASE
jgi:hypothetical protein